MKTIDVFYIELDPIEYRRNIILYLYYLYNIHQHEW